VTRLRTALALAAVLAVTAACAEDAPPEATLIPPTPATGLVPDTGAPDGGSGNTTPEEQVDACSALSRAYFTAIGADGAAAVLQPLYDAVTPLLPEAVRGDWETAAAAFIAYEDAASSVPQGDDRLAVPEVREAYDEARGDEVQEAMQRVRDGIDEICPGVLD
jgi:hypothetical protein